MSTTSPKDPETTTNLRKDPSSRGLFYVGMAALIAALAIAGFWPSYWSPLLAGTLDLHWLIHLHGIVFTGWMVLLVAQTVLVYRRRTDLHQQVGAYVGIGLGLLVFVIGLLAVIGTISPAVGSEHEDLQGFVSAVLAINLPGLLAFGVLFGAGIAYRSRPAVHKRLMLVATLTLLSAATFRMFINGFELSHPMSTAIGRTVPLLIAGLGIGHDWRTRGRVHPAYWFAAAVLIVDDGFAFAPMTEVWTDVTRQIAAWLESVLRPLME